jgi:hypothetical protein
MRSKQILRWMLFGIVAIGFTAFYIWLILQFPAIVVTGR